MIVCKYCGSHNIKTYSDSGNPFDRHPEVTVCGDCGRLLSSEADIMETMCAAAIEQSTEEELAEIMSDPDINIPLDKKEGSPKTIGEEQAEFIKYLQFIYGTPLYLEQLDEIKEKIAELNIPHETIDKEVVFRGELCPYCNKTALWTSPSSGDPERKMCMYCGRTVDTPTPIYDPFPDEPEKERTGNEKRYVRLKMHAHAMGVHRIEGLEVPAEDGEYDLSKMNYPLCRFGTFKIECGKVALDDEVSLLTRHPLQTVKKFTAYAPDKSPWEETIEITIKEIWK